MTVLIIVYLTLLFIGLLFLTILTVVTMYFWNSDGELSDGQLEEKKLIGFWWKWIWVYPLALVWYAFKLIHKFRSSK